MPNFRRSHTDAVLSLVLLKKGFLASSSGNKIIKLWNLSLTTGHRVKTFLRHTDCVSYLVELKNGKAIQINPND